MQEGRAMFSHPIVMMLLTHPLHVLLVGVILSRALREVVSAARAREASRVDSGRDRQPVAMSPSDIRAA
jgi:hypothetical protein